VNVAGVRVYAPLADAADWERIIGVNVLGTAHCCKAALPRLRAAGRGTIVNVSSVYGVMGRTGMGQYDTTKAAVLGFTRALAVEEAPHRIRINAVCPAAPSRRITSVARRPAGYPRRRCHAAGGRQPARALAEPREVATPSCSSPGTSRPSHGATLMVDAGRSIL